jgi:hypothetical protein
MQTTKKRPNIFGRKFSDFLFAKNRFKKDDVQQNKILQDLGLLIVKNTC